MDGRGGYGAVCRVSLAGWDLVWGVAMAGMGDLWPVCRRGVSTLRCGRWRKSVGRGCASSAAALHRANNVAGICLYRADGGKRIGMHAAVSYESNGMQCCVTNCCGAGQNLAVCGSWRHHQFGLASCMMDGCGELGEPQRQWAGRAVVWRIRDCGGLDN